MSDIRKKELVSQRPELRLPTELVIGGDVFTYRVIDLGEAKILLCSRKNNGNVDSDDFTPDLFQIEDEDSVLVLSAMPNMTRNTYRGSLLLIKKPFPRCLELTTKRLAAQRKDLLAGVTNVQGFDGIFFFQYCGSGGAGGWGSIEQPSSEDPLTCDLDVERLGIKAEIDPGLETTLPGMTPVIIPCPRNWQGRNDALVVHALYLADERLLPVVGQEYQRLKRGTKYS